MPGKRKRANIGPFDIEQLPFNVIKGIFKKEYPGNVICGDTKQKFVDIARGLFDENIVKKYHQYFEAVNTPYGVGGERKRRLKKETDEIVDFINRMRPGDLVTVNVKPSFNRTRKTCIDTAKIIRIQKNNANICCIIRVSNDCKPAGFITPASGIWHPYYELTLKNEKMKWELENKFVISYAIAHEHVVQLDTSSPVIWPAKLVFVAVYKENPETCPMAMIPLDIARCIRDFIMK
jgi:hypothetical protein